MWVKLTKSASPTKPVNLGSLIFLLIYLMGLLPTIRSMEMPMILVEMEIMDLLNGATLTTDRFGIPNRSYSFDGVSNDISVVPSTSLDFSASFTVSVWAIKKNTSDEHGSLIATGGSSCTKGIFASGS